MILLRQFVLLLLMLIASGFGYAYPENKSTAGINLPNSTLETGNPQPAVFQQVANQATSTTNDNRPSVSDGVDLWRTPWTPVIGIMLTLLLLATARLSQLHRRSRQHVARLITLIEQWPQPMLLIEGGLIVETNPAALRLLGYRDNQELLQRRPEQISPERQPDGEDSTAKAKRLLDTAGQGQLQTFHWVHRHKNGHDLHVDVTLAPIDLSGRTVVLCSWFDISDIYRTQLALVESESRFRRIFEKSTSVMLLLEPGSGRIISANEAATRYYGHPPGQLLTMTVADINTLPAEQVTEEHQRALNEERNYFIFKHCLAGGEIRDVEVYATPIEIGERTLLFSIVHDITERMRTSEALQKQESYQRALIDNFPFLIWLKDTESRFLAVNRPFAAAAGLADPYQLSGKTDLDIWPEELAEAYRADDALVMHSGQKKDVIEEIRHPDGNRWFETYKSPVYDHAGQLLGTVGFARDISDRMQTEEALRLEQGRAQRYLDTVQSMMVALDREGRISMINRAGCELLGYAQEELIGRNWFATCLPQPDGLETILPEFHRLVARRPGPIDAFENQVLCRDGSQRLMSWRNAQLLDDKGNITGILSSGQDITEIQQVMEELERERGFLNTLVQTIPDLVWLKDLEGVYLACNPRFERFFGASSAQILGKRDYDFVSKEMADFFREHDRKAISKGRPSTNEEVLTFADDGHVERVETTKTPMYDAQGQLVGVLGVARDITDRKQAEQQLHDAESRLRIFIERFPGAVLVESADRHIMLVNQTFCDLFQIPVKPAEIIGLDCQDSAQQSKALFKEPGAFVARIGELLVQQQPALGDELVMVTGRVLERDYMPVRNEGGMIGHVWLYRDISDRKQAEQQLRESEASYRSLVSALPDIVMRFDRQARHIYVSENVTSVVPFTAESFLGKRHRELGFDEEHCDLWEEAITSVIDEGESIEREFAIDTPQGRRVYNWRLVPDCDADGSVRSVLTLARDITERKRGEDELRLAANVFTHAREGITITDAQGNILEVNDAFTQITGYSRAEVLGQNPRMLQSGRHGPEFYADMWRSLVENGQWSGEIWNRDKSGGVYAELLTISSVRNTAGKVQNYVALFSDITKLKEHQKQLEHIAHHDALTGLPNRVLLADRLNQAMSQAQRRGLKLAVAYLDLDGFKSVNDNHGHSIGDQLLLNLTARLKQALREGDTIARLGGDEFVAVLIDLTSAEASVPLLSRLLKDTAQPMQVGSLELQVSGSLGVTFFPQEEDIGPDQLIRQADQAMYQAKLAGKNRYHIFDPEHDRSIRGHHESLDGIRAALEERQFVLHYQPKVNMRSGEVIGVEALIRWQHPHQGLLPPSYFLPVIEDHPLAIELGEWVIETALSQHEAWKAAGLVMPVSVNVGANQLQQNDFMERLRGILAHHPELQPQSLELEVLETSALEDLDHVSQVVQACQEIGVNFALDDFGTGYSSLTYLKRLRATQLKIDRSFVSGILDDPEDLAILEGVLGLARAFRRQAIAEGVETLTHGVMLLQLGCELAQGYAIARAMPAEELPHWIETWRPDPSWRDQQAFNHDDLGLLFACVEHRAWVSAIEHALELQNPPPPLDHNKCRFSLWLAGEGRLRHGGQPALYQVETLHRQVHELAAELLAMQADGQGVEAKARLHELYQLRDSMLELLTDLAETINH